MIDLNAPPTHTQAIFMGIFLGIAFLFIWMIFQEDRWKEKMSRMRAGLKNPFHVEHIIIPRHLYPSAHHSVEVKVIIPHSLHLIRSQNARTQKRQKDGRFKKKPK